MVFTYEMGLGMTVFSRVGNQFSRADVQLLETLLIAEEYKPDILAQFPLLQSAGSRWGRRSGGWCLSYFGREHQKGNKNSEIMAGKPKLHYTKGRGKMESIRWLLAAAGVEFEEEFIEKKEDLEKLRNDGSLMFQQVPMVEIDGMKMVQSRAILSYIAAKYNLYGKDLKERAWIDMYVEGTTDLMGMIMYLPFQPADTKENNLALIIERATTRYFPVYEKALKDHGHDYLVGNKLSWADIHLLEAILMVEECKPDVLSAFPLLQAFKGRTSNIPTIKKFLQPGSQRKPPPDEKFIANVKKIFNM
ncbi:glutathione S-transferase [Patagioenas fasciata monilis]|uniref:Glutathione S-transferase n=1 Tax=Patagioenas fasciata monilis TaxID=372326 RepID=A0A1V4JMT7_PATFA|nr:glutathione S-transferase [Patagioenas fasciata monilis]